jgi:hypothetical protein
MMMYLSPSPAPSLRFAPARAGLPNGIVSDAAKPQRGRSAIL